MPEQVRLRRALERARWSKAFGLRVNSASKEWNATLWCATLVTLALGCVTVRHKRATGLRELASFSRSLLSPVGWWIAENGIVQL